MCQRHLSKLVFYSHSTVWEPCSGRLGRLMTTRSMLQQRYRVRSWVSSHGRLDWKTLYLIPNLVITPNLWANGLNGLGLVAECQAKNNMVWIHCLTLESNNSVLYVVTTSSWLNLCKDLPRLSPILEMS